LGNFDWLNFLITKLPDCENFVVMAAGCLVWGTPETDRRATMVLADCMRREAASSAATGKTTFKF
jgi:hypothetical protein